MMNPRRLLSGLALAAVASAVYVWQSHLRQSSSETQSAASTAPQRIASMALASDEVLAELVPLDRIACVTRFADDAEISNVAGFYPSDIPRLQEGSAEQILAFQPDLVCVASFNSADFLKVIKHAGLAAFRNDYCDSIDEIEHGILELGSRVGEPARARQLVGRMRDRRQHLADRLRGVSERPRVLFWSAGFTAGRNTTIDDIIREGGGLNVALEQDLEGSAAISPEAVIAANPDYVLLCQWSADDREGRIENHPLLRNLPAVREQRVVSVQGKYLTAISQHVVEGAERLAQALHAECFDADR